MVMAGLESLILNLKAAGFDLVLLWLLTLAIVYGILSHVAIPKSVSARGVISLVIAFLVLFGAAGPVAVFLSNIITAFIMIAFGLIIAVIFLEITGTKVGGEKPIFAAHPKFFGAAILILTVAIFVGAGGLNLLGWKISITEPLIAIMFVLVIMAVAVWVLLKETEGK